MRSVSILLVACLGFISVAGAQQNELIDRTFSGSSKDANPQVAKKEIQDQASLKISEDIIRELIGEEHFNKKKSLIHTKIIQNSARYIPYAKASPLVQEGEEQKMSVVVKVSLRDLRQLLQQNNLLNENEDIPVALPLISWVDRVQGRSYRWWIPGDRNQTAFLLKEARLLENALRRSFQKNSFFLIKPIESGLGANVPAEFQTEKIYDEDATFYSQYFNAPILIDGQVLLNKGDGGIYQVEIRMTAIQVSNGRAIADVSRRYDLAPGSYESTLDRKLREVVDTTSNDLASQVLEASQRGSLGTSVLRLTISGRNTLPSIEIMKEKIRSQLTQVKNIRERVVGADAVSFEVDTSASTSELMAKLETIDVEGRRLVKVSEKQNELVLRWAQ